MGLTIKKRKRQKKKRSAREANRGAELRKILINRRSAHRPLTENRNEVSEWKEIKPDLTSKGNREKHHRKNNEERNRNGRKKRERNNTNGGGREMNIWGPKEGSKSFDSRGTEGGPGLCTARAA